MVELRKKEFKYRGKKIEELREMDTREFAKYLPSRAKRSVLRHFDIIEKFVKKCKKKTEKGKQIKTHSRTLVVVPKMVGHQIMVHTGREFMKVEIINEMLGHRLGEFAPTRSRVNHGAAGIGATRGSASRSVK